MPNPHLDHLEELVKVVKHGNDAVIGPLSTGERIYVALAASRADLLPQGYGIPDAMYRMGAEWVTELMERHKYD